jgi:hypothetical protein
MPTTIETIDQLEDELGLPIVLMTALDRTTNTVMVFRLRDLPATGIAAILQWLNARRSTP